MTRAKLSAFGLDDQDIERVRQMQHNAIRELQRKAEDVEITEGVLLADGEETIVPHGLGRAPRFVTVSVPRGAAAAGYVNEVRSDSHDRTKYVVLQADDYGATITVDVEVK